MEQAEGRLTANLEVQRAHVPIGVTDR
jgi:hypothetical protein